MPVKSADSARGKNGVRRFYQGESTVAVFNYTAETSIVFGNYVKQCGMFVHLYILQFLYGIQESFRYLPAGHVLVVKNSAV